MVNVATYDVYKILIVTNVGGIDYKIYISLGSNIPFKSAVLLTNHYITSWALKFHLHQVRQVASFKNLIMWFVIFLQTMIMSEYH